MISSAFNNYSLMTGCLLPHVFYIPKLGIILPRIFEIVSAVLQK